MVDAPPQNRDGSRWLNCLIEGENDIFRVTVHVEIQKQVMDLKDAIQNKRKDLKDVNPELGIVDIDLNNHDGYSLSNIRLGDVGKLKSWESTLHYWPDQPPNDHLHIIVKVPVVSPERVFKRPRLDDSLSHTPPPKTQASTVESKSTPPRLTRQETETKMAAALVGFEKYIEYLATGELDGHLDSIRPEDKLSKFGVHLPLNPTLLIHDLGKHTDQERIQELFERGTSKIIHLFSVSGSGKTRLSLDGLCSHWGLYISCRTMTDTASGSNDFKVATDMLQDMNDWGTRSPDLSNNSPVAHRAFTMLLCARVFILKQLVQHFPVNTKVADAQRRWVLAQVLPPRLLDDDLFVKVFRVLRSAKLDTMRDLISESLRDIITKRTDLFPIASKSPLVVVIDEAQVAAEYLKFFRSASGTERCPILREIVDFFRSSPTFKRIIISGTGLSMEMVTAAVGSLSAKEVVNEKQGVFTDVGRFTREDPPQEAYIRRYLTLSNNDSDTRLLERIKYWFSGRYRLTASLIEIFLHSENVPRHRVLTLFVEHLTGFKITDAIELEADEPPISPDLKDKVEGYRPLTELGRLFKEEGLSNRMLLINGLVDVLMRWTLGSGLTSIPIQDKMHEMIALGVGFLDQMPCTRALRDLNLPVYISEPLVVLSLRSLFEEQRWTTLQEWMVKSFHNALNPSTLGYVFEMAVPLVLMETFWGKFSPLEEAFHLNSESLASRRVTLVSLKRVTGGKLQTCPVSWNEGSSDRLGFKAKTHTDVLNFLDDPKGKVFLFLNNHMLPDLLWFFQDEDTKELIIGVNQSKAKSNLDARTWQAAINSVTPELVASNFVISASTDVYKGERVQYAQVTYPNLVIDSERTSKINLGEDEDAPEVVDSQQSASNSRKTPRFLRIISSLDDKQDESLDGMDDLGFLRFDKMKNSTLDSVVNTIGSVVL